MPDTDPLLDTARVAQLVAVAPDTIRTYLKRTRRRETEQLEIRAYDFPIPDQIFGDSPTWRRSTIDKWLDERTKRQGPGRPPANRA
jgi:predicted DNA-binding transcriptional regulator AlpA